MLFLFISLLGSCGSVDEPVAAVWQGEFVSSDLNRGAWYLAELPSEQTKGVLRLSEYDPVACAGEAGTL